MNKNILIAVILVFSICENLSAQELRWKAGFYSFFDNREYFNPFAAPQSILGARTFAEGGFKLDHHNEFGMGVNYLYEFGSEPTIKNITPILYYHHLKDSKELYMGAFSRKDLVDLPNVLLSDTFNYYRPNIEGIYIKFSNAWGYQNIFLDWTSRQTSDDHETFIVGGTGRAHAGRFFGDYSFMLYHFAGTATVVEGPPNIRDNGGLTANLGANLTDLTPLDSLSISTGFVGTYDRVRAVYDLLYYTGSLTEVYSEYNNFAIRSTMYLGTGHPVMIGDQMYRSHIYNRTDLIYKLFRMSRVSGFVEFSLHFLPSKTDFSQKFTIYLDISGKKKLK